MEQTDLLSMLEGALVAPFGVPDPEPVETGCGAPERLFEPVWTMPGQLALEADW